MMSAAEDRKFRLIVDGSDEPEPDTVGLRPTDYGNAERLVAQHGDELRYVPGVGWHAWDGVRWRRDDTGEVVRRAKQSARTILTEAEQTDDAQERKILAKWALTSETDPRLRAAISLAESELQVITRADELDAHEWLLTVENGTLDLRDGALQPHAQADLLTKLAPVIYQPDAASDVWDQFLETVTGGDDQLAAFLQRLSGYTLTGSVRDEVLMFVHGPAATGKTTFVETIKAMLGEHAMTADFETFLRRRGDAGIRNDIARLAGARMVLSVEVDDGKALAEGLIKTLTGGDTVTARHLYSESFSFTPAFKLWLAANDRPPGTCHGRGDVAADPPGPLHQHHPREPARPYPQGPPTRTPAPRRRARVGGPRLPRLAAPRTPGARQRPLLHRRVPPRERRARRLARRRLPARRRTLDRRRRPPRRLRTVVHQHRHQAPRRRPPLGHRPQGTRMHTRPTPRRSRLAGGGSQCVTRSPM